MHNLITDIPGVRVGHAQDQEAVTGVTCVLFERPNAAAAAVGGGAPGTRELAILEPDAVNQSVDAVVLSGGSAFGLDAAGGVMAELAGRGVGVEIGSVRVPIVSQAIVFDLLNGGRKPVISGPFYWHLGREACLAARDGEFALGSVGGGYGATTANLKGGIGSASIRLDCGVTVAALAVVNAVGSVTIADGPHFWAGAYERGGEFGGRGWPPYIDPAQPLPMKMRSQTPPSTTIAIVATDAVLTKPECKRVAIAAHDGLARAVRPAHAPMDGDVVFAVARPHVAVPGVIAFTEITSAAADCLARAIARAVFEAATPVEPYAGPSAYRDVHGAY